MRKEVAEMDPPWITTATRHDVGRIDIWEPLKNTEEDMSYACENEGERRREWSEGRAVLV